MQVFEKAYAKLAGSYAAVEFGSEDDGLVSLTGVTELVCLHVVLVCAQTSCKFGCDHAFVSPKTSACIIMETHTHTFVPAWAHNLRRFPEDH